MTKTQRLRRPVDITMTILSITRNRLYFYYHFVCHTFAPFGKEFEKR